MLARMGCQLIVTPNIHSEVIRRAVGYGMTVRPGCATATEAFTALEAGAGAENILVIGFWSAIHQSIKSGITTGHRSLCRWRRDARKLAQWIDAGCAGAGLGSDPIAPGSP